MVCGVDYWIPAGSSYPLIFSSLRNQYIKDAFKSEWVVTLKQVSDYTSFCYLW